MSDIRTRIVIAAASVLALRYLLAAVRASRREGDIDSSSILVFGMAWLINLPVAAATITGGYVRRKDVFDAAVVNLPGWYPRAVQLTMVLVGALALGLLADRLVSHRRVVVNVAPLLAIVLWSVAQLSSGLNGGPLWSERGLVLLTCLMAACVLPRGRSAATGVGIFGVTLAIASGLAALVSPSVAFHECSADSLNQCSVFGAPLVGVLSNQNLLGVSLAATLPFAYLGFGQRWRWPLIIYVAGIAITTGSLTASITVFIIVGVLALVRPGTHDGYARLERATVAGAVLVGAVIGSVYFVRHDWRSDQLTGRPELWSVASSYIDEAPWLGYGPLKWATLFDTGEIPQAGQRSTHNQVLDVLFVSGRIGAALLVLMLIVLIVTAERARLGIVVALAAIVIIGSTEGAWSVGAIDGLSFSLVGILLLGPKPAPHTEPSARRGSPERFDALWAERPSAGRSSTRAPSPDTLR